MLKYVPGGSCYTLFLNTCVSYLNEQGALITKLLLELFSDCMQNMQELNQDVLYV